MISGISLDFLAKQSASILEIVREMRVELRASSALLQRSSGVHPIHVVRDNTPTREISVPDLDSMTVDELRECSSHFSTLSQYASLKCMAVSSRKGGRIGDAVRTEAYLEKLYQLLPKEWKW